MLVKHCATHLSSSWHADKMIEALSLINGERASAKDKTGDCKGRPHEFASSINF